jgi:hypothetical protein
MGRAREWGGQQTRTMDGTKNDILGGRVGEKWEIKNTNFRYKLLVPLWEPLLVPLWKYLMKYHSLILEWN